MSQATASASNGASQPDLHDAAARPSPPPLSLPVSIVVPVFRGGAPFRACLSHLQRLTPPPLETIVVVDGPDDDSQRIAESFGATVIANDMTQGPARARNLGAQAARGDLLFFVDADVAVPPDAIATIVGVFESYPELAALIGSYDDAPAAPNFLSQYKNLLHHYVHQTGSEAAWTFWGACGAIRREIFLQLGGFDERYRQPSIEDIELGYRLVARGYRIRLHKALQVTHLKRWSARSLIMTDFFGRALPWTTLILRDRRMANDLNLQRSSRISVACAWGLVAALLVAPLRRWALLPATGFALPLLALNMPVYRFLAGKRGWWFAMRAVPWHWLYYFYSGLALATGTMHFLIDRRNREAGHVRSDVDGVGARPEDMAEGHA
jgi:GT2 family glycosyltransferase